MSSLCPIAQLPTYHSLLASGNGLELVGRLAARVLACASSCLGAGKGCRGLCEDGKGCDSNKRRQGVRFGPMR